MTVWGQSVSEIGGAPAAPPTPFTLGRSLWLPASCEPALRVACLLRPKAFRTRYTFAQGKTAPVLDVMDRSYLGAGVIGVPRNFRVPLEVLGGRRWTDATSMGIRPVTYGTTPIALRPNGQERVVAEVVRLVRDDGAPGAVIEALPGKGKTVMLLAILQQLGVPALVLVHSEQLLEQWVRRAGQFFGLAAHAVGVAQQARCDGGGHGLVIGLTQSVAKDRYGAAWKQSFGAIVFDECDLFPTEVFTTVLGMFPARYRLAATATLERKDGMSRLLDWHVGPVAGSLMQPDVVPDVYVLPNPWEYNPRRYSWRQGGEAGPVVVGYSKMLQTLAADGRRNALLLGQVRLAHGKGRRIVVLTHEKAHANALYAEAQRLLGPTQVGLFTGDVKKQADLDTALACPVVIGTYKMLGRGIDVPDLDVMVLATPLSDPAQAVGRVLRYVPGKPTPIVLDVDDAGMRDVAGDLVLAASLRGRKQWYASIGAGGNWREG